MRPLLINLPNEQERLGASIGSPGLCPLSLLLKKVMLITFLVTKINTVKYQGKLTRCDFQYKTRHTAYRISKSNLNIGPTE